MSLPPMSTSMSPAVSTKLSPFLERLVRFLMPFFLGISVDIDATRIEIVETLQSYGARTRSEMLNAARIIAFGMSALDTLGESTATELSASMRLRFRGCANGLNRSSQQNEKTLASRLACDIPEIEVSLPDLVDDVPDAEVDELVRQTRAHIESCRNRLSGARPANGPQPGPGWQQQRNKGMWGGAMMDRLAEMGMPVKTAPAA